MKTKIFHEPYLTYLAIDSTLCEIQRPPSDIQGEFYSVKHKRHGLKYEVAVRDDGLICWVYGSIPGSVHDITIVREGGIENELLPGETVIGDRGYAGEDWLLTPFKGGQLTEDQMKWNQVIENKRYKVENTFAWLKKFEALKSPWRHEHEKNEVIFRIGCHLTNMLILDE